MPVPFDELSETAGMPIADEAAAMMLTRYATAASFANGRRTLELACASGPGLGLLRRAASQVVGGDINYVMAARARAHYRERVPIVQLSAEALPFANGAFDCVLLLEASYYVPDFERALAEICRVLSPRGRLMLTNANPERGDFIRSPFSHTYHTAQQLRELLEPRGFRVDTFGAFPLADEQDSSRGLQSAVIGLARRILEALHLVPRTLRGRARLKRLLGQRLRHVPSEIDETFAERAPLTPLPPGPVKGFKVFYITAERGERAESAA